MDLEDAEDVVANVNETSEEVVEDMDPVVYTTTSGHMEFVPTNVPTEEPLQRATRRMQPFVTNCPSASATAPDRLGFYLLLIQV